MDDRFMHGLERDPDPEFASRLERRLERIAPAGETAPRGRFRFAPAFGAAVAAGALVLLFVFPSVRASAQAMLDLFRVRNFAPVNFDPDRMERFKDLGQDGGMLVFDQKETLVEPGPRRTMATAAEATAAAGYPVRTPAELPEQLTLREVTVEDRGAVRVSADGDKLRELLDALDLRDVQVPRALDGQWITLRKPPVVFQRFASEDREVLFIQAPSPEIDLPPGAELGRLAEVGLRVLGVERAEAQRLARNVDWHTTLLVPVPMNAASFRAVEVNGQPGLMITTTSKPAGDGRRGRMLMWSSGGHVYAISGNLNDQGMVHMAESVR